MGESGNVRLHAKSGCVFSGVVLTVETIETLRNRQLWPRGVSRTVSNVASIVIDNRCNTVRNAFF